MRTTRSVTISLPPEQLKTAERLAKRQSRTMSELFREGLRRLIQEEQQRPDPRALAKLAESVRLIRESSRRAGLDKITTREISAEVTAARKEIAGKPKKSTNRSGK